jgi:hypothetical protein
MTDPNTATLPSTNQSGDEYDKHTIPNIEAKFENSFDIVIAVPSFERADCCYQNTFALLTKVKNIFPVYFFVTNDSEREKYQKKMDAKTLFEYYFVVTNTIGLAQKRNFITHYFEDGQFILQMDDDIQSIVQMIDRTQCTEIDHFCKFVVKMFRVCCAQQTRLWGVYPLANPYFMNEYIWVGRTYIVGAFFGLINDRSVAIENCLQEDKERSLLFAQKHGGVVRCNYVGIQTRYWKNDGGMQSAHQLSDELRNHANIEKSIARLFAQYPAQICAKKTKKNYPDVRIINKIILKSKYF